MPETLDAEDVEVWDTDICGVSSLDTLAAATTGVAGAAESKGLEYSPDPLCCGASPELGLSPSTPPSSSESSLTGSRDPPPAHRNHKHSLDHRHHSLVYRGANPLSCSVVLLVYRGANPLSCSVVLVYRGANPLSCSAALVYRGANPLSCSVVLVYRGANPLSCSVVLVYRGANSIFSSVVQVYRGANSLFCSVVIIIIIIPLSGRTLRGHEWMLCLPVSSSWACLQPSAPAPASPGFFIPWCCRSSSFFVPLSVVLVYRDANYLSSSVVLSFDYDKKFFLQIMVVLLWT